MSRRCYMMQNLQYPVSCSGAKPFVPWFHCSAPMIMIKGQLRHLEGGGGCLEMNKLPDPASVSRNDPVELPGRVPIGLGHGHGLAYLECLRREKDIIGLL